MGQNAVGQSDYRIFKSTITLEQYDEKAWFFECWYKFMESRSWLKNIEVVLVKNRCGHCSQDSKIGCMLRTNEWNKLIFGVIHES